MLICHVVFNFTFDNIALERVQLNGRIPAREQYADVYQQRTIKLSQKVHVPIKDKKVVCEYKEYKIIV